MDEQRVALVRATYDAWTKDYLAWVDEHVPPDFELVQAPEIPGATTYRGPEGLKVLFRQFAEVWEEFIQGPTEFKVVGDRIAVVVHQRARGKESGIQVEQDVGHLWEFRGPVPARVITYSDPSDAFRALEE